MKSEKQKVQFLYFDLLSVNKLLAYGNVFGDALKINRQYYYSCLSNDKDEKEQQVIRIPGSCHMLRQLEFFKKKHPAFDFHEDIIVLDFEEATQNTYSRLQKIAKIVFVYENGVEKAFSYFLKSSSMAAKKCQIFYINEEYKEAVNERVTLGIEKYITGQICVPKYFAATGLSLSTCLVLDELRLKSDEICIVEDKEKYIKVDETITAVSLNYIRKNLNVLEALLKKKNKKLNDTNTADDVDIEHTYSNLYEISKSPDSEKISNDALKKVLGKIQTKNYKFLKRDCESFLTFTRELLSDCKAKGDKVDWFKVLVHNFWVKTTYFDGEGLMDQDFCTEVNDNLKKHADELRLLNVDYEHIKYNELEKANSGTIQFRLPFTKGCLHAANLKQFFKDKGINTIKGLTYFANEGDLNKIGDSYCEKHNIKKKWENPKYKDYDVSKLKVILTEHQLKFINEKHLSLMFKDELMKGEKTPIECFFDRLYDLHYGIGINNVDPVNEGTVKMTYEFWSTLPLYPDLDESNKKADIAKLEKKRQKEFEQDMKNLCEPTDSYIRKFSDPDFIGGLITCNKTDDFLNIESEYLKADKAFFFESELGKNYIKNAFDKSINDILRGRIAVPGERRFFASDLLYLLYKIIDQNPPIEEVLKENQFFVNSDKNFVVKKETLKEASERNYVILRVPHYSRNEIVVLKRNVQETERKKYFPTLKGVLMVNPSSLTAERLAGGDFDGDTVYVITSPIINKCSSKLLTEENGKEKYVYPIVLIPGIKAEPSDLSTKRIVKSWQCGFNSKIGFISNDAFKHSMKEYKVVHYRDWDHYNAPKPENEDINKISFYTLICGIDIDSKKTGLSPTQISIGGEIDTFATDYIESKDNLKRFKDDKLEKIAADNILVWLLNRYKSVRCPRIDSSNIPTSKNDVDDECIEYSSMSQDKKNEVHRTLQKYFFYSAFFDYIDSYKKTVAVQTMLFDRLTNSIKEKFLTFQKIRDAFDVKDPVKAIDFYRQSKVQWHTIHGYNDEAYAERTKYLCNLDFKNGEFRKFLEDMVKDPTTKSPYFSVLQFVSRFKNCGYKTLYHLLQYQRISDLCASNQVQKYKICSNYLTTTRNNVWNKMKTLGIDDTKINELLKKFENNFDVFIAKVDRSIITNGIFKEADLTKIMKNKLNTEFPNCELYAINAISNKDGIKSDNKICSIYYKEIIKYLKKGDNDEQGNI